MARSSVTAKQLIYDAKMLLGIRDSVLPNNAECIRFINYSIFTLSNLLDGLYDVWERKISNFYTRMIGDSLGIDVNTSGNSYTASTKTIATGDPHGLTSKHVGGLCVMYDAATYKGYCGIINTIPSTTTFTLVSDPRGTDIAGGDGLAFVVVPYPWYTDGFNISSLNIKKIVGAKDAVNGVIVPLNHNEFQAFENNPNLESSMGLWEFGGGVHIKPGTNVTTLNQITLHYNADPTEITAITDSVDLETEHHTMIVSDIARQIEKAYPGLGKRPNQTDPFADLRKLYDAADSAFINKKLSLEVARGV